MRAAGVATNAPHAVALVTRPSAAGPRPPITSGTTTAIGAITSAAWAVPCSMMPSIHPWPRTYATPSKASRTSPALAEPSAAEPGCGSSRRTSVAMLKTNVTMLISSPAPGDEAAVTAPGEGSDDPGEAAVRRAQR